MCTHNGCKQTFPHTFIYIVLICDCVSGYIYACLLCMYIHKQMYNYTCTCMQCSHNVIEMHAYIPFNSIHASKHGYIHIPIERYMYMYVRKLICLIN